MVRIPLKFCAVILAAGISAYVVTAPAGAAPILFEEDFQDVAPSANVTTDYPNMTFTAPASTSVDAAGVLKIVASSQGNAFGDPDPTPLGDPVVIRADIGATNSNGNYNVGLMIGSDRIVFHPGYSNNDPNNLIRGALRVEGPGGDSINQDMGWVPANNVLHHFEVSITPAGLVTYTVTDGSNPGLSFTNSFTFPGAYNNNQVGFTVAGGTSDFGLFDNLQVIPEPAAGALVAGGIALLGATGRRRRGAN